MNKVTFFFVTVDKSQNGLCFFLHAEESQWNDEDGLFFVLRPIRIDTSEIGLFFVFFVFGIFFVISGTSHLKMAR